MYGFTSQNPSCMEVCSNEATTKQRKINVDGRTIVVYKPLTEITEDNCTEIQFLDFMSSVDRYSELSGELLQQKLKEFTKILNINFEKVKEYIYLFPDKVYKNLYQGGLMGELV